MNFPTWSLPVGVAADKSAHRITRFKAYLDTHTTRLVGGVRPKPTIETISLILDAFDLFGAPLTVEEGGYGVAPPTR